MVGEVSLDLSSNDLRVAGAKAMAALVEMDILRRENHGRTCPAGDQRLRVLKTSCFILGDQ